MSVWPFNITNPGFDLGGVLTSQEASFVTDLYAAGSSASENEVLMWKSGAPSWEALAAGSGDVVGPASAVDSNFAAFNLTTGKLIKDSGSKASDFATASHNHAGVYAPALGADDNYVTDAEKAAIGTIGNKIDAIADPNADRILFWDDSAGAYAYLTASTGLTISATSMTVRTSSATQTGIVELAIDAEAVTGTDTARAVTPANLTARLAAPGAIGGTTPASVTATTVTTTGDIELGHASDTTLSRVSAGVIAVEGVNLVKENSNASAAEVNTGTSTTKFVTPDALAGSNLGIRYVQVTLNGSTALTTSDVAYFRIPAALGGMNLVSVAASVGTGAAGSSSSGIPTFTVTNVTQSNAAMLSTALTVDAGEYSSATAATAAVIDGANDDVASDDLIKVAVTTAGTGVTYAQVVLGFALP